MTEAVAAARFGFYAAGAVAVLGLAYGVVLAAGLITLAAPASPIGDPWFTLMEGLIVMIAPAMVCLAAALHGLALPRRKPSALAGLAFMGICAGITCAVHFAILMLSRLPAFAGQSWAPLLFSFEWPSVAYALDVLAWDFFFPLGAACMAAAVEGAGRASVVRKLLYASAALAFAGLAGLPLANMQVRNLGIIGYAVLFPLAAALLAALLRQAGVADAPRCAD